MKQAQIEFSNKLQDLSLEKIHLIAQNLQMNDEAYLYLDIYESLLGFTKNCIKYDSDHTLIGLAHMVYGWMPTMLKNISLGKSNLIKMIQEEKLTMEILIEIVALTNNSVVGASKLLHFIEPDKYAIFDSRVYSSITGKTQPDANNIDNYLLYIDRFNELITSNNAELIYKIKNELVKKKYIYKHYSSFRALEVCLYNNGK